MSPFVRSACLGDVDGHRAAVDRPCSMPMTTPNAGSSGLDLMLIQMGTACLGDVHGHQAAVAVVHQQVRRQGSRREVVHAAGAVGDIAHHHRVLHPRMTMGKPRRVMRVLGLRVS